MAVRIGALRIPPCTLISLSSHLINVGIFKVILVVNTGEGLCNTHASCNGAGRVLWSSEAGSRVIDILETGREGDAGDEKGRPAESGAGP